MIGTDASCRPRRNASATTSARLTTRALGASIRAVGADAGRHVSRPGTRAVAWNSALLYDMIYTQPVVYELGCAAHAGAADDRRQGHDGDRQGFGAAGSARRRLATIPCSAKEAAAQIPHAKLVEFPDLGHAPQIQAPERFHKALLEGLRSLNAAR